MSKIKLGVRPTAANAVEYDTNDYDSLETDTAKDGSLVCTPLEIAVTAPSSDTAIKAVSAGINTANKSAAISGNTLTVENDIASVTNYCVNVTANDSNATYQVVVGDESKLPADNTTGAKASGTPVTGLNIASTTGVATLTIRVIAPNKTATQNYTLTVTNTYAAINTLTVTPQRPGGAVTVPKNGLDKAFAAATYSYTIYVPSDVPKTSGVQIVPTNAPNLGIKDTIAVTADNKCTAPTSITSGGTLAVTDIENDATVTLKVTAADGKTQKTYTFTFKKVDIDTSIASFTMTGLSDGATYNNDSTKASADYFFSLPSSTGFKGKFQIKTTSTTSTVAIGGKAYSAETEIGPGSYTVTVTAEAGNTKNYSVIVENKYDAAKFEALSVAIGGGSYEDIFAAGSEGTWEGLESSNAVYTREAPVSANTEIKIKGTASAGASVTAGNGLTASSAGGEQVLTGKLSHGKNEFRVTLATDEGSKDYTFVINVLEKKNAITGMTLTNNNRAISGFTFNAATKEYNVNVPYSIANARLTVTTDGTYTRVFAENGDMFTSDAAKKEHSTTFTFTLPSPTATVNTLKLRAVSDLNLTDLSEAGDWYTITVTRGEANKDATLSELSITINGEVHKIPLEENRLTYSLNLIELGIDVTSMKGSISATAKESTSTISGVGEINFNFDGDIATNTFPVKVTAEDGTTKTYVIAVARNGVNLSKDDTISKVTIMGNDAEEYFNGTPVKGATQEIYVPFGVEKVNVSAIPGYASATVVGSGVVTLNEKAGVATEIKLYAVAESGDNGDGANCYIFKIIREEQRASGLANLIIDGTQVYGFDKDKTIYSHSVVSSTESVSLRAIAENEDATVKINAGVELAKGKSEASGSYAFTAAKGSRDSVTFTISVEIDNESRMYTVTVVRASESPQLVSLRVGNYTMTDQNGNMVGNDDADALSQTYDLYVNIDINFGTSIEISAKASDELAILKISKIADPFTGSLNATIDLDSQLENSPTADVRIIVTPQGSVGYPSTYDIHFTVLTSDTSAEIDIFQGANGTNPLVDFNSAYKANPSAPVYGPYTANQATLEFKITLSDKGGAVGEYEVRRRNNQSENLLMINNGTAVDGGIRLAYGTNVFCVKITSSDKKAERSVVVIVERGGIGATVEVSGKSFIFNANATSNIWSVDNTVTKLDSDALRVKLTNDDLEYELNGNTELEEGGITPIEIRIYEKTSGAAATADREPLQTFYVNVLRQAAAVTVAEPTETPLWQVILFWALVALVVIELIIIIAVPKRKKSAQQVVVAATPTVAYVPPVQTVQTVQPVQPQAPQAPQAPAAPAPQAPPPPAPRPAEPPRSANAKPFVSPDNSGYYDGNSGGYYGNGGYGNGGYGNGGYGNGSYGGGYGNGGYGGGYDDNDKY